MNRAKWKARLYASENEKPSALTLHATESEARAAAAGFLGLKNLRGLRTWYDPHHDRFVLVKSGLSRFATFGQERPNV